MWTIIINPIPMKLEKKILWTFLSFKFRIILNLHIFWELQKENGRRQIVMYEIYKYVNE